MNPSALSDTEFLIKSTFEKFDPSRELGWCLTASNKDAEAKLNVRPCKPYETRADNLQLWTFGPNNEIMLAGTSSDNLLCIKSTFRQLKLETCDEDESSQKNFSLGSNFISQTRNGKTFYFGFDPESRFERVRLYREGALNEVLNKWTVVYRRDIPDAHLLFTSAPSVSLVPSSSPIVQTVNVALNTASFKEHGEKLNVRPCKPYETRADNLQLWTFGPNNEIMLAGTSSDNLLCIKSTFRQLKLETCDEDESSQKNFSLGSNFISQTRNGKTFYFGFDPESRFERVRLYREGALNEVLNKWTVVYRRDIPDAHLLFTSAPSVSLVPSSSPIGSIGYICYNSSSKNWDDHRTTAQESGADLVTVHCQEQNAKVNLLTPNGAWIGASDKDLEGTWKWVDGTTVEYENWYNGEPNDSNGGEDCALRFDASGTWNDAHCINRSWPAVYESNSEIAGLTCIDYVGKYFVPIF